jgi:hypothetical protein
MISGRSAKQNRAAQSKPTSQQRKVELGFNVVTGVVTGVAIAALLAGVKYLSQAGREIVVPVVVIGLGTIVLYLGHRRGIRRWISGSLALVALLFAGLAYIQLRPSAENKLVHAYAQDRCSDGMWTGLKATCYDSSIEFLIANFSAIDPSRWHGWDEFKNPTVVGLSELAQDGPPLAGRSIASVGEVLADQDLGGGQATIQLAALEPTQSKLIDNHLVESMLGDNFGEAIRPTRTKGRTREIVYCNLTLRPFLKPQPGDFLVFKGVLLANGITKDIGAGGNEVQASYVTCSTVERVNTTAPATTPTRTTATSSP